MPTFSQPVKNNQIIIVVALSLKTGAIRHSFKALVDTGAQITAVSLNAVEQLGLTPIAAPEVRVATGQSVRTFAYRAWVDIPIQYNKVVPKVEAGSFFWGKELPVVGLSYNPEGYDVLLGMDLLGIFHVDYLQQHNDLE